MGTVVIVMINPFIDIGLKFCKGVIKFAPKGIRLLASPTAQLKLEPALLKRPLHHHHTARDRHRDAPIE